MDQLLLQDADGSGFEQDLRFPSDQNSARSDVELDQLFDMEIFDAHGDTVIVIGWVAGPSSN
jgi:hypothetical protein